MKKFKGILNIPEGNDLNRIPYILFNTSYTTSLNLTEELETIYKSKNKQCGLVINYNGNDIFCEAGKLYQSSGLWYINSVCIDFRIWDLAGKSLEVILDVELEEVS
jgi:hypothetical protein